ncbi:MAG: hypothetical protein IIB38_07120 [Candidatus Hydrogenedentes bacterium]|nr:hypothetical protein [Candidatus Hydrogenedentota bacterium]
MNESSPQKTKEEHVYWFKYDLRRFSFDTENVSFLKLMVNSSGTQALRIYYCNSSYSTGNPINSDF